MKCFCVVYLLLPSSCLCFLFSSDYDQTLYSLTQKVNGSIGFNLCQLKLINFFVVVSLNNNKYARRKSDYKPP